MHLKTSIPLLPLLPLPPRAGPSPKAALGNVVSSGSALLTIAQATWAHNSPASRTSLRWIRHPGGAVCKKSTSPPGHQAGGHSKKRLSMGNWALGSIQKHQRYQHHLKQPQPGLCLYWASPLAWAPSFLYAPGCVCVQGCDQTRPPAKLMGNSNLGHFFGRKKVLFWEKKETKENLFRGNVSPFPNGGACLRKGKKGWICQRSHYEESKPKNGAMEISRLIFWTLNSNSFLFLLLAECINMLLPIN